jgi:flavin-dependent dehydrogenase
LNCAKIAGEVAYEALKQGDTSAAFLSIYQKRWQEKIDFDMAVMRRMRLVLNRLSDSQLDRIVAMSSQLGLDKSLTRISDIDFQGKGMQPLFRSPAAWTIALYMIISSLTSPF